MIIKKIEVSLWTINDKNSDKWRSEWGNLGAKLDPHEAKCLFRMEGNFLGSWIKRPLFSSCKAEFFFLPVKRGKSGPLNTLS